MGAKSYDIFLLRREITNTKQEYLLTMLPYFEQWQTIQILRKLDLPKDVIWKVIRHYLVIADPPIPNQEELDDDDD